MNINNAVALPPSHLAGKFIMLLSRLLRASCPCKTVSQGATKTALGGAALLTCFVATTSLADSFAGLGQLAGHKFGGTNSAALGISGDGVVVVGEARTEPDFATGNSYMQAFRWTAQDGMQPLGVLSDLNQYSSAKAVSDDGRVVVGQSNGEHGRGEAFFWTAQDGAMQGQMQGLGASENTRSEATGVSSDGRIIVGIYKNKQAFRWTLGDGMQPLGALATKPNAKEESHAADLSDDGSVIVGGSQSSTKGVKAVRWVNGAAHDLKENNPPNNGKAYKAVCVTADGNLVMGIGSHPKNNFFCWTQAGGIQWLGSIGPRGQITDMSADGSVVVGQRSGLGKANSSLGGPFIWTKGGGMQSLQELFITKGLITQRPRDIGTKISPTHDTDWTIAQVTGISDDGQTLVGTGNHHGQQEAWIAHLDTEPPHHCKATTFFACF